MLIILVEDFPMGFPRLSCFLDSDDAFMLYRRFGTVFSRLILNKQDEISRMEVILNGMDNSDERNGNTEYLKSCVGDVYRENIPKNWRRSRPELMQDLENKVLEYGESQICSFQCSILNLMQRSYSSNINSSKR